MADNNFNADARRLTDNGNKCAERLVGDNANWQRLVNRPVPQVEELNDNVAVE